MQVFLQLQLVPVLKIFLMMYFIIFQGVINLQLQVQIIIHLSMVHYAALVLLFNLTWVPCRGPDSALDTLTGGLKEVATYCMCWERSSASPLGACKSVKSPNNQQSSLKSYQTLTCKVGVPWLYSCYFLKLKRKVFYRQFHMKKSVSQGTAARWTVSSLSTFNMIDRKRNIVIRLYGTRSYVPPKNCEEEGVLLMSWISIVLWAVWRDCSI